MMLIRRYDREVHPGKGRGSKRTGRTGVAARIITPDDGLSFYVVTQATKSGQLTGTTATSTHSSVLGEADEWARDTLAKLARIAASK